MGDRPEKHSDMGMYGPVLTGEMGGESFSALPSSIGAFSSCSSTISMSEFLPIDCMRTEIKGECNVFNEAILKFPL